MHAVLILWQGLLDNEDPNIFFSTIRFVFNVIVNFTMKKQVETRTMISVYFSQNVHEDSCYGGRTLGLGACQTDSGWECTGCQKQPQHTSGWYFSF